MSFRSSIKRPSLPAALGALVALGATFAAGVWLGAERVRARDEWTDGQLLSTAIDSVRANALDSLPSEELVRRAVTGMLRELHDPYAAMLRSDSYKRYRGSLHGEGMGMGMSLRKQAGMVSVARVADASPAAEAGVRRGDRVLSVNGVPISEGWGRRASDTSATPLDSARVMLWRAPRVASRGADSLRDGNADGDTVAVRMDRKEWHVPAVTDAAMLSDSIGYVRLNSITSRSSEELERAVTALHRRGARALLLDLRGNGGGLFDEGVRAAGLFLPRGALVASLAGRGGVRAEEHRVKTSRWSTMRLTILVDGGTASAAEVIAAALREHDRALLVGTPTYGKGVVQRVVRLTPDISLRLTTARWLTPKGHSLERRQGTGVAAKGGLIPDVLLDDASRTDPFSIPREWSAPATMALSNIADSLALHALRDGWPVSPVAALEARLRNDAAMLPVPRVLVGVTRNDWISVATRISTVRLLEFSRQTEPLLRYSARTDAALRAGLDALSPGIDVSPVFPTVLMAPPSARVESKRKAR